MWPIVAVSRRGEARTCRPPLRVSVASVQAQALLEAGALPELEPSHNVWRTPRVAEVGGRRVVKAGQVAPYGVGHDLHRVGVDEGVAAESDVAGDMVPDEAE